MADENIIVRRVDVPEAFAAADFNLLPAFLQRFDREQTRRAYKSDLSIFFGTDCVDIELARRATFLHVNEYISKLENHGHKPSTIKRKVAAIRGFFNWLEALDLLDKNPAKPQLLRRIRRVNRLDSPVMFLSSEQAADLIAAAADGGKASVRDATLIKTMLHCVLRRSEAAAMNVDHVRPMGRYWILDLPNTKSGSGQYVKIPPHVVDDIDDHRNHYGISSGPLWRSLSNNSRSQRLSTNAIYTIVRKTAAKAGLSDIGAHTLRHTGCTLAIEAGASLQQVQSHARHKSIETTMVYIHQRDRLKDSAADYIHVKSPDSPPEDIDDEIQR